MRSVAIYSLVVFYFLISIRLTGNFHYCCGKLKSVSIVGFSEQINCCKKQIAKKPCCENVRLTFQKTASDHPSAILSIPQLACAELPYHSVFVVLQPEYRIPKEIVPSSHAPPPDAFPPRCIAHCVYRI